MSVLFFRTRVGVVSLLTLLEREVGSALVVRLQAHRPTGQKPGERIDLL
jgi:hypothetical protein